MAHSPEEEFENLTKAIKEISEKNKKEILPGTYDPKTKKITWGTTRPSRPTKDNPYKVKPGKPMLPDDIDDEPLYHEIEE